MGQLARRLVILGSTGSIGTQVLSVVRSHADLFEIVGLGAGRASERFEEQLREFGPKFASLAAPDAPDVQGATPVSMRQLAALPDADLVVVAIPGIGALEPTLAAIAAGKNVALASKEALVVAGGIVMGEAERRGVSILPLDSEHNAIWQCIRGEPSSSVARVTLTASGGPFRDTDPSGLAAVTPAQALAHPTWQMGPKVTVDSATLMNKGFEVIEAHWLYGISYDRIDVVLHPRSIVHSFVEFLDGSVKAQLSEPDMRLPIQYALTYPDRIRMPEGTRRLELSRLGNLEFLPLDEGRFACFALAREAARNGGTYPAVLNSADEVAVDLFLEQKATFDRIPQIIEATLDAHRPLEEPGLEELLEAGRWARDYATALVAAGT